MQGTRWKIALAAALAVAGAPEIGSAQGWRDSGSGDGRLTPLGEYVLLGGGVSEFTEEDVKNRFKVGGAWDLRLGLGSRFFVGGELAYVGAVRDPDGFGSKLLSNGAEAVVRVQYPYETGAWLIEPFAFGGIGWSRVSLQDAAPDLKDEDDVGVVPFGAGVTFGYRHLLLDARFTYRTSFDEDLALAAGERPANLEQWGVVASVGYEF